MLNIYNFKALIEMSVDLISTQPETNLTVSGFLFHHNSELKSSGIFKLIQSRLLYLEVRLRFV